MLQVFSKAGDIKRIVMGLDKMQSTPCGFCFVVYYTRLDTEDCCKYINGMSLDERLIRVDFDWGFRDGRQFGRGKSGGQVRGQKAPRGAILCLHRKVQRSFFGAMKVGDPFTYIHGLISSGYTSFLANNFCWNP